MQAVCYHSHIPHNITYTNSETLVAVVYKITNEGDVPLKMIYVQSYLNDSQWTHIVIKFNYIPMKNINSHQKMHLVFKLTAKQCVLLIHGY